MATIYQGLLDMISLLLSLLSAAPVLAQRDSFYPPLNHTTFITNASLGTYGGIYAAPATTASPPTDVYNYCSMPHPRVESYAPPPPVANHSVSARLVYLEYVQRHQRRTPYNILPGGENNEYHCDNIHPHLYASSDDAHPVPVYAAAYSDPSNPFLASYVTGSCQYPQLTRGGLLDGLQHGADLRAVYADLIPATPDPRTVWLRSSASALTQGSAGGVLRGLWPDHPGPLPLHQQPAAIDTVDRSFPCAARDTLLAAIQSTAEWAEHLAVTAPLRAQLARTLGANTSDWQTTFDHFADNFQARRCHADRLPCSVADPADCVSDPQAEEVFRAGDWEWNYWWRTNPNATRYIQLVEGLFIGEIVRRLEDVQHRRADLVYSHNFVHDGDIGPVLGALGIRALRWPGMAANIAFEVWETSTAQFYARVLYSGRVLETIHGPLDWVPLARLTDILKPFIPADILALCKAS